MDNKKYIFGTKLDNDGLHDIADLWDSFISKYPNVRIAAVKDPYHVLGVTSDSSPDEIRAAFKNLARTIHPDVNKDDPEAAYKFAEIQEAYDVLREGNYVPPTQDENGVASFINKNHHKNVHISNEELLNVINGGNFSNSGAMHFPKCRLCNDRFVNLQNQMEKPKGFMDKFKRKFNEFLG